VESLIILVALFVLLWALLIRPQKAKQRAAQEMLNQLSPGDEVITIGGIYGDVVEVHDDKVVVEIAEDVHIEVARRAISSIVPQETHDHDHDHEGDHDRGEPLDLLAARDAAHRPDLRPRTSCRL